MIGLAGGVASGKSLVASCLEHFGASVLDADQIGHEVLEAPETVAAIVGQWGEGILTDGKIDRRSLARIVFAKTEVENTDLERLEKITHPEIGKRIRQRLADLKSQPKIPAVVLDAPVMFKAQWNQLCDKIIFVETDLSIRQQRASQRGWDSGEIARREAMQTSLEVKRSLSTDFINNSKSREETYHQIRELWRKWKLDFPSELESPSTLFQT